MISIHSATPKTLFAVVLLLGLGGCDSSPKGQIERVLKKDKELGAAAQLFIPEKVTSNEDLDTYATVLRGTTQQSKAIDLSGCPPEFASAYIAHVRAWEDFTDVLSDHPHVASGAEAFIGGFLRGVMGDLTGGAFEVQGQFREWGGRLKEAEKKIKESWRTVEDVAMQHGARLP